DRDRGKRPIMGQIAEECADLPIVTSDNPRSEDPEAIIREVLAAMGDAARRLADRVLVTSVNPRSEQPEAIIDQVMEGAGADAERDADRRRAIRRVIGEAEPGDVVVIAGKGHEQGQEFENGRKEPFDDLTEARDALRARVAS
ncbi:MAG TPA: cyanophycin synthetase, partial [Thermoleophilaceae bacterium]|nr:cyanophycin synthetase [Thermoleophilaceae bacterium]